MKQNERSAQHNGATAVLAVALCVLLVACMALSGMQRGTQAQEAYAASSTTQAESETPVPLVYELEPASISIYSSGYGSITPDFIYVFEATEDSDSAAQSYYADWVAEYVVSFDTSGADSTQLATWKSNGSNVILAGQYVSYSTYWYPICLSKVTDGTEYKIMETVFSSLSSSYSGVDYLELCGTVKTFKCTAVQSVTSSNADSTLLSVFKSLTGFEASSYYVPDGMVMTVELRLYESYNKSSGAYGNYVTIGSYDYTFGSSGSTDSSDSTDTSSDDTTSDTEDTDTDDTTSEE